MNIRETCPMHSYTIVSSKTRCYKNEHQHLYKKTHEKYGGIRPLSSLNIKHATCNLCNS